MNRIYHLDMARGIAAIGIVIFHFYAFSVWQLEALFFFVDFFFVLSGFVLHESLQRVKSGKDLRIFIVNRAQRLFPMAWAGILYVLSIQLLINIRDLFLGKETTESIDLSVFNIVINLTLLQIFSTNSQLLLFPLWSLSAEWITNLLNGLYKLFFSTEKVLILVGFVLTTFFLFGEFGVELESVIGSLGRCLYGFGIGMLFYELRSRSHFPRIAGKIPLALICICVLYFSYFIIGMKFLLFIPWGFGFCITILAIENNSKNVVSSKLSSFLGLHSYGIYVWHIPMQNSVYLVIKNIAPSINLDSLHFLHFVATLLLSVLASWIVIIFLERPLKRGLLGFS